MEVRLYQVPGRVLVHAEYYEEQGKTRTLLASGKVETERDDELSLLDHHEILTAMATICPRIAENLEEPLF